MPLRREYDKDFRHWEWQILELRLDTVLRAGGEWLGGLTRENIHWSKENGVRGDDNGDITIVLDLETGYRVHGGVREPCTGQPTDSDNALGIVRRRLSVVIGSRAATEGQNHPDVKQKGHTCLGENEVFGWRKKAVGGTFINV